MGGQQSLGHSPEDLTTSFCYYDGKTAPKIEQVDMTVPEKDSFTSRGSFGKRFRRRVAPGNRLSMVKEESISESEDVYKILIIGDSGVGKTSLVQQLTEHTFSDFFIPTIGRDCRDHSIQVDGTVVRLQIWDTGGQNLFRTIRTGYYKKTVGVMIVYSATDEKSFKQVTDYIDEVDRFCDFGVKMLLVANKADESNERVVNYTLAKRFADRRKIPFIEVSAKDGRNVNLAFRTLAQDIVKSQQDMNELF